MATITVNVGAIAFQVGTKKKISPKYRFNKTGTFEIRRTEQRGCGEFAKTDYLITVEGLLLAVSGSDTNKPFFVLNN